MQIKAKTPDDYVAQLPDDRKEAIQKLPSTRKKPKEKIRPTLPVGKVSSEAAQLEEDDEE